MLSVSFVFLQFVMFCLITTIIAFGIYAVISLSYKGKDENLILDKFTIFVVSTLASIILTSIFTKNDFNSTLEVNAVKQIEQTYPEELKPLIKILKQNGLTTVEHMVLINLREELNNNLREELISKTP